MWPKVTFAVSIISWIKMFSGIRFNFISLILDKQVTFKYFIAVHTIGLLQVPLNANLTPPIFYYVNARLFLWSSFSYLRKVQKENKHMEYGLFAMVFAVVLTFDSNSETYLINLRYSLICIHALKTFISANFFRLLDCMYKHTIIHDVYSLCV